MLSEEIRNAIQLELEKIQHKIDIIAQFRTLIDKIVDFDVGDISFDYNKNQEVISVRYGYSKLHIIYFVKMQEDFEFESKRSDREKSIFKNERYSIVYDQDNNLYDIAVLNVMRTYFPEARFVSIRDFEDYYEDRDHDHYIKLQPNLYLFLRGSFIDDDDCCIN